MARLVVRDFRIDSPGACTVARVVAELNGVRACFARGELSYSKVRALSRIASSGNEDYLLMLAQHCTAAQLEQVVRNYRRCTARDLAYANAVHANRYVSWSWDDDGCLNIRGQLSPEDGQVVVKALEAGLETLRAQALTPNGQPDVSAETQSREASHADVLALMAETLLANGPKHRGRAASTEVVVHVDAETLAEQDHADGMCHIEEAAGLHPETARRLGCDASLVRIIERDGRPLTVGRKSRTIPPALRRALQARDRGCRYPGCSRKGAWVDGHHIKHWAHGGNTELENLVQLCYQHHRLVHEGGFTVEAAGSEFVFRRPGGQVIPAVPRAKQGHESRIRRHNRIHAPGIGPTTCLPLSRGERLDHAMAVDGLLQADGCFASAHGRAPPG
ncbi:MAG: DUF222 domain-containing protein [Thermoleophilaceae bacterium]